VCSDDTQLDAEVPASFPCGPRLRHHQSAVQYISNVHLPRNGIHRRHCLSERKGKRLENRVCAFAIFTWPTQPSVPPGSVNE